MTYGAARCRADSPVKKSRVVLLTHFPLSDTARAGLSAALAGALQLQLAGRGGTVDAVVQFLAQRATRQITVNFPLPFAMAAHHNSAGHVGQIDAIIRLVHLLAALAAAAPAIATCAVFYKCS